MAAKYFSVEEVLELVTEDTTDENLDEDGGYEESDGFEKVMRQKLEELAEFAAEIQPEFDEDTFKTSTLRFGLASFTICSTRYGNTMKTALETNYKLWINSLQRKPIVVGNALP